MDTLLGLADLFGIRAVLIGLMIFLPLERLFSLHPGQAILRKGIVNDFWHVAFNSLLGNVLVALLVAVAISAAAALLPVGLPRWVAGQPLWLQVIEIVVVTDIGVYVTHRMLHAVPFLWRFHSIHHAIEEMDCLAAFHNHPVEILFTKSVSLLPVFFLGFSGEAIFIYSVIYTAHVMLIHANIKVKFGPLTRLIVGPQFHHWHHANEKKAYDKNFAGQLAILDVIFGTYRVPESTPSKYGVDEGIPQNYFGQIGYPLAPRTKLSKQSVPGAEA